MFATLDFYKSLIMHHAEKNKNVFYRLGRSVLKNIFPVRTSHPVNNIYIFSKYFPKITEPEANNCFSIFTQVILILFISLPVVCTKRQLVAIL